MHKKVREEIIKDLKANKANEYSKEVMSEKLKPYRGLHNHPNLERWLELDDTHVIVNRDEWLKHRRPTPEAKTGGDWIEEAAREIASDIADKFWKHSVGECCHDPTDRPNNGVRARKTAHIVANSVYAIIRHHAPAAGVGLDESELEAVRWGARQALERGRSEHRAALFALLSRAEGLDEKGRGE